MPEQSWCVDGPFFAHFSTRGSAHCNFIISDGHLLLSKRLTSFIIYCIRLIFAVVILNIEPTQQLHKIEVHNTVYGKKLIKILIFKTTQFRSYY